MPGVMGQAQPLASSGWSGSAAARLMGGTGLCAICGAALVDCGCGRLAQPLAGSGSAAARLMGGTGLCAICGAALAGCGCGRLRFEHVASPEPQGKPVAE